MGSVQEICSGRGGLNISTYWGAQVYNNFAQNFGGLEHTLDFFLHELVRNDSAQADENEQRMIEQRLRDLGYL